MVAVPVFCVYNADTVPSTDLTLQDFDYALPRDLIAPYPQRKRSEARLLVLDRKSRQIEHRIFRDLTDFLQAGDLLVLNNTKVLPARIFGRKATGGRVEALLLKSLGDHTWQALLKPSGRVKLGSRIQFGENGTTLEGEILDEPDQRTGIRKIRFGSEKNGGQVLEKLNQIGRIPLPPYIDRPDETIDREMYQTVFAEVEGAVASPTAGLHFDEELLGRLRKRGIEIVCVTLHVSYGTFQPVQVEDLSKHQMYEEEFEISEETARQIARAKQEGRRIVACGTTVVRTLETVGANLCGKIGDGSIFLDAVAKTGKTEPSPIFQHFKGITRLFIYPPYEFKIIDAMITNFHLPKSTLLMLVSAFSGCELLFEAYQEAIRRRYRFYSYGDAMLIV